jgi:hypothetical protein
MLDKTQASIAQSTVVNATNLAVAIASRVVGETIPDEIHGESVTRNTINRIVIDEMRNKHIAKGE